MTEKATELSKRLVFGHKRDGRCDYDKEAKRELIELCLRPGVSIARMALQHGINANLLRTWMRRYCAQGACDSGDQVAFPVCATGAFVPVVAARVSSQDGGVRVVALLPNGIKLYPGAAEVRDLSLQFRLLIELPCSGSTPT